MEHHRLHVLFVAAYCINTITRMQLAAEVTDRTCACNLTSCNFSQVCSPTPNCIRENVALGKPANMSSSYAHSQPTGPACLAVNGNTDTAYKAKNETNPNCIHTEKDMMNATWLVNLGRDYTIKNITVYIRSEQPKRMDNVIITVDDQDCYVFPTDQPNSPPRKDVSCTTPQKGSIVKFYKNSTDYMLNICEVQVWVCTPGLYGLNCEYKCNCKDNGICDNFFGTCTTGCREGFYGSNCTQTCGNCKENRTCDFKTGQCLNGCRSGWQESMCTVCRNYTFGSDCKTCGHCRDYLPCNASNGACIDGCLDGFIGPLCEQICRNGTYGPNCSYVCGYCNGGNNCNASNGVCLDGCAAGYQLPMCNETCQDKMFGPNCRFVCGKCKNGSKCKESDGQCVDGCEDGLQYPFCTDSTPPEVNFGAIAGGVGSAIIVMAIFVLIIILLRRRYIGKNSATENSGNPSTGESDLTPASTSSKTEQNSFHKPQAAVKPTSMKTVKGATYTNVVLDASNVVSCASNVVDDNQYSGNRISTTQETTVSEEDVLLEENTYIYGNDESVYAALKKSGQVLDRVQSYLIDKLTCGELIEEFKKSAKDLRTPHTAALTPINLKKNRFAVIVPYDRNRVILKDNYNEGGATDYVNASFIKGFLSDVQYIAAQGPRDNTVTDFWRMVWQERVKHIVMVTSVLEGGKSKCYEYWPAKDTNQTYGPVKVTGLDVQSRACFFIRTFVISCDNGGEYEVTQYHFTAWPDHGVPTVTSLVDFWRFVKSRVERDSLSPLLVHCSAGVGRTGTYIGLDIGMDACLQEGEINILELVDHMRDDRTLMVQTPEQYVFLHKALLEAYTGRHTKLSIDQFDAIFSQPINAFSPHSRIDKEFKTIMQMRSLISDQSHTNATAEENVSKNRNESVLPSDSHIVYLTEHIPGRNQYINAVYMSTYTQARGCILTQLPLKNSLIDFWRLVDGTGATTVVSIGSSDEERNIKEFCRYWPESKNPIKSGPYSVTLKSSSTLGKNLTNYSLSLAKQGSEISREIQLLRHVGWDKEIPNMSDLLHLVDILDTVLSNSGSNPSVIQCIDGGAKCAFFCAIRHIISRVYYDREVDVYMTVREVQTVRPQAITTVEQYRFCYEVAQVKVRELSVYANA